MKLQLLKQSNAFHASCTCRLIQIVAEAFQEFAQVDFFKLRAGSLEINFVVTEIRQVTHIDAFTFAGDNGHAKHVPKFAQVTWPIVFAKFSPSDFRKTFDVSGFGRDLYGASAGLKSQHANVYNPVVERN